MEQDKKSEKSRAAILEAALNLFSSQGYRGTSIREIAQTAGVSTGNVYHHFPDKETIFQTVLGQYWKAIESPDFPFNRALASGTFPDNLEALAFAARESVRQYRKYVALIYVDVVEFEGDLRPGDVIYAVNGVSVRGPAELRSAVGRAGSGEPLVLHVERSGKLVYVVVETE